VTLINLLAISPNGNITAYIDKDTLRQVWLVLRQLNTEVCGTDFRLSVRFGSVAPKKPWNRFGIVSVRCLIKKRDSVQNFGILNSLTND